MNIYVFMILLAVTAICNFGFCRTASILSMQALDRPIRKTSWVIWMVVPLIAQAVIVRFFFAQMTYIIIMVIICAMEWLTIRRPKSEDVVAEEPVARFFSWFMFSLPAEVGLIFSTTDVADKNGPSISLRDIILRLVPLLVVVCIGLVRVALCEDDAPSAETLTDDDGDDDEDDEEEEEEVSYADEDTGAESESDSEETTSGSSSEEDTGHSDGSAEPAA